MRVKLWLLGRDIRAAIWIFTHRRNWAPPVTESAQRDDGPPPF